MLRPLFTWLLDFETAILQSYSKVYQNALKTRIFVAFTMRDTPNFDKLLPLHSFVFLRIFHAAFFLDKRKPLRQGPSKKLTTLRKSRMSFSQKTEKISHTEWSFDSTLY